MRALFGKVPLACVGAGIVLALATGGVGWVLVGVAAALGAVAPQWLSRRARLMRRVAKGDQARLSDLRSLAAGVGGCQGIPGAEDVGLQIRDQFDNANAKFMSFRELLGSKFDPGELTYGRYLKSADQVYRAILDDVQRVTTMLGGLKAMDVEQIQARLRILKRLDGPSDAETSERDALEQRLALREQEMEGIRALIASNERALTTLALAGTNLSQLETQAGRAALDADTAMKELEALAQRAERYALDKR